MALPAELEPAFLGAFDPQAKLVAALGALGPVADRDVLVVDATAGPVVEGLTTAGGRIVSQPLRSPLAFDSGDGSSDVVLGLWSAFRGVEPTEVAEVDQVPPAGRTPPRRARLRSRRRIPPVRSGPTEYGAWSHRFGPFLQGGFRVRVVHCFWEFASQEAAAAFLAAAFGEAGATVARTLKRPRLSYNVAVYHRSRS